MLWYAKLRFYMNIFGEEWYGYWGSRLPVV